MQILPVHPCSLLTYQLFAIVYTTIGINYSITYYIHNIVLVKLCKVISRIPFFYNLFSPFNSVWIKKVIKCLSMYQRVSKCRVQFNPERGTIICVNPTPVLSNLEYSLCLLYTIPVYADF